MLSIFKRFSKVGRLYKSRLLNKQQIQVLQKGNFSENFGDEYSHFDTKNPTNSSSNPRNFSRLDNRNSQERGSSNSLKSILFKCKIDETINYLTTNEIKESDYYDIASILASKIEYESPYKIRNLEIDKLPLVETILNHFSQNLENMNSEEYTQYAYLTFAFNLKNVQLLDRENFNKLIDKGKVVYESLKENSDPFKIINLNSILGNFTNLETRDFVKKIESQLTGISTNQLIKFIKRYSLWQNYFLKNNQFLRPILQQYLSVKDSDSFNSKIRLFKTACIIDSKISSEYSGRFVKEIGECLKDQESLLSSPLILSIFEGLAIAKTNQKSFLLSRLHKGYLDSVPDPNNLFKFLSLLGRLSIEEINNLPRVDYLVSRVIFNIDRDSKTEDVLNIYNLIKMKRLNEPEFIQSTFEQIKYSISSLNYNQLLRSYKNSLSKANSSFYSELGNIVYENSKTDILTNDFRKNFNTLLHVSNLCEENLTETILETVIKRIKDGEQSYRYITSVINEWAEKRQEFVNNKIKMAISEALISRLDLSKLSNINEKNNFRLFLNLSDLVINRKNEEIKNKYYECINYLKNTTNFKENFIRNLLNSVASEYTLMDATLNRCLAIIRELYTNKEITFRNVDVLIQILFYTLSNNSNNKIDNESFQSFFNYIDSIYSKVDSNEEISYYKYNNLYKMLNSNNLSSKFVESMLFKRFISSGNMSFNQDTLSSIANLLNSSLSLDDKQALVKKIFEMLKITNSEIRFSEYKPFLLNYIYKIVAFSNKVCPEIADDNIVNSTIQHIKESLEKQEKYNLFNSLSNLVLFNNKYITNEIREEFSSSLRGIINDINIRYILNKVQEFPMNRNMQSLQNVFLNQLAKKYENTEVFDKGLFVRVLEIMTKNKLLNRKFFNRIIEQYGSFYEIFSQNDNLQIISYFARINFTKHDILDVAIKKINFYNLDDNQKLALYNNLCRLDYFRNEKQIEIMRSLLRDLESYISKGEFNLYQSGFLNFYYSKTFFKEFYDKTINVLVEKFNSQNFNTKKSKYSSFEENLVLTRCSLHDKIDPELIKSQNAKVDTKREYFSNNFLCKVSLEVFKLMKLSNVQIIPNDLPCHFYLPNEKICIFLLYPRDINFSDESPIHYIKMAMNECSDRENKNIIILVNDLKEHLKTNEPLRFIKYFEELGFPNLTTDNNYDLTELSKLTNNSLDKSEVETEEVAEELEKIRI